MAFTLHNTKASKLTGAKVIEIRAKYASRDYTQEQLSREYQVSINTIRNVVRGVTWQHLGEIRSEADVLTDAKLSEQRLLAELQFPTPQELIEPEAELPEELLPKVPNPYL